MHSCAFFWGKIDMLRVYKGGGNLAMVLDEYQRFRIELRKKMRIGRLVKVLSIFGQATEVTANSHGFFESGSGSATPIEGFTSRKIAMKIPGASRSIGRGSAKNLRATCRQEPLHCRVRPR
jgi:hypothetical protein